MSEPRLAHTYQPLDAITVYVLIEGKPPSNLFMEKLIVPSLNVLIIIIIAPQTVKS